RPVPITTLSRLISISLRGSTPVRSMTTLPEDALAAEASNPDTRIDRLPYLAISFRRSGTDFGVWMADIKSMGVYETHASKVNKYVRLSGLWKLTSLMRS